MSEVHQEGHSSPIKTPKQLITVVLVSFLVPIAVIVMLSQLLTTGLNKSPEAQGTTNAEAVAARIKPLGQVEVTDPNAPKVEKTGKEVVDAVCSACHATGALNAPKIGDKAAWAPHLAGGLDHLTQNAIKGLRQMPPRGGNPDLSDLEVTRALVYMTNQSGASFKEPAGKPATDAKGAAK